MFDLGSGEKEDQAVAEQDHHWHPEASEESTC